MAGGDGGCGAAARAAPTPDDRCGRRRLDDGNLRSPVLDGCGHRRRSGAPCFPSNSAFGPFLRPFCGRFWGVLFGRFFGVSDGQTLVQTGRRCFSKPSKSRRSRQRSSTSTNRQCVSLLFLTRFSARFSFNFWFTFWGSFLWRDVWLVRLLLARERCVTHQILNLPRCPLHFS